MRITLILPGLLLLLVACNKDKFTTAPQISLVKLSPNYAASDLPSSSDQLAPAITLKVTDAEGDLGNIPGREPSKIFVKNLSSQNIDSFDFPSLGSAAGKNFSAEVTVNLYNCLDCVDGRVRPYLDTTYYEIYINDFERNKSNTINTLGSPVYFNCL
jgi:hypothetical protein